jgi:hypothetical protein
MFSNVSRHWKFVALIATFALILLVTALSPLEATLGWRSRVVYFHGAWVWTGKVAFALAGLAGLLALVWPLQRLRAANWSLAFGRVGLFFWLTYLPMSVWVQQITWGGIFWDEPRWRIPLAFGIAATLLQVALWLFNQPLLTSGANLVFGAGLWIALGSIQNILHPDSPIFGSGSPDIEIFFVLLMVFSLLFMAQLAWLLRKPAARAS